VFDLFPQETQEAYARGAIAERLETTPEQAFAAAYEANRRTKTIMASWNNLSDAAQDHLDMVEQKTGQKIANPYALGVGYGMLTYDVSSGIEKLNAAREQTAALANQHADSSLSFPDSQRLYELGLAKVHKATQDQARLAMGMQDFGTGGAAMAGEIGAQFSDPLTAGLNTLALITVPSGGLLRSALMTGVSMGAQQAVQEGATYDYRQAIDPNFGPGQAAEEVLGAAAGGVGLDLAGRLIGKTAGAIWRNLSNKAPEVAARLPTAAQDAGIVAERSDDLVANNPFRTGATGAAAHYEAIQTIEGQILRGDDAALPPSGQAEAGVRTGSVIAAPEPSPFEVLQRAAWNHNPELFQKAWGLDNEIASARSQLADAVKEAATPPDMTQFAGNSRQIKSVEEQLAQITGKRRSSPRAQVLRDQLASLQEGHAAAIEQMAQDAQARGADTADALRQRVVDLQDQRAQLGPEINAAHQRVSDQTGITYDKTRPLDASPSASGNAWTPPDEAAAPGAAQVAEPAPAPAAKKGQPPKEKKAAPPEIPPAPAPEQIARAAQVAKRQAASPTPPARSFYGDRAVNVKYELAEAGDLIASHDGAFNVNPAYPEELQPRNRGGKPAREQVIQIAQNLQPERMGPNVEANSGAPIVGPDNVVESGNGRAMALRMAYGKNAEQAAAYRAFLERSGFDTSGLKEPVLVARRTTKMTAADREAFAHAANGSASLRMSAAEQALSDARHLASDVTHLWQGGEVNSQANAAFVRAFIDKLPPGERGGIQTQGGYLSASGVNRIRAALVARAFDDPGVVARAFDHADSNIKSIASALVDASPDWIKFREAVTRGEIPASHDVTEDLMRAVKTIMRARDEGEPVAKLLAQGDMFHSDVSQLTARMFFKRTEDGDLKRFLSKGAMADNLSGFAREMTESAAKGTDMFGAAPVTAKEALSAVVSKSDAREAALARFATPEKDLLHAADDPKVQEALNADLERNIAQGQNRVPVMDKDGNVTLGFADAELHKIDGDLALAKELNACNIPMSAQAAAE
jgi:hypothetical protein